MSRRFAAFLVFAMLGGVAIGALCHHLLEPDAAAAVADNLTIVTDLFLRLIKMIIAPLVLTTLVAGIAHMGDASAIGRVGAKTMAWFLAASVVSLLIGLVMARLLQPGADLGLALPHGAAPALETGKLSLRDFVTHLVPRSIVEAMAQNEILQIVVFSVFAGVAVSSVDDKAPAVLALVEQVAAIMLKVTGYVMTLAPLAVFAALAAIVAEQGLGVLATYAKLIGGFYLALAVLWAVFALAAFLAIGRRVGELAAEVRKPALIAFSSASSEAAYPLTLQALERFGVSRRIASFVLPLGYSFNLDGSMMYCAFAVLFIAQAYGIELTLAQEVAMLLLLMVTSKGMAGVPRAALVVIAATLTYLGLPPEGLLLILAVDQLLDMGRSATNVIGNSLAAVVVQKFEGGFASRTEPDQPSQHPETEGLP